MTRPASIEIPDFSTFRKLVDSSQLIIAWELGPQVGKTTPNIVVAMRLEIDSMQVEDSPFVLRLKRILAGETKASHQAFGTTATTTGHAVLETVSGEPSLVINWNYWESTPAIGTSSGGGFCCVNITELASDGSAHG